MFTGPHAHRPTGFVPAPAPTTEERARHIATAHTFGGGIGALPPAGSIPRAPWVLDQRGQSCFGHGYAQWGWGLWGEKLSPYFPWWWARSDSAPADFDLKNDLLPDVGVTVPGLVHAAEKHGACSWDRWNPNTAGFDLGRMPNALSRMQAIHRKIDVVPIWDRGQAAMDQLIGAMAQGLPTGIVVHADDVFRNPHNGVVDLDPTHGAGDHFTTGWGWRTVNGKRQILDINSWGTSYGAQGTAWFTEERINQSDFLCIARKAP
jgi:hypothetical protein